ncbi:chemotaxis protein CheW [Phototrophicus methaneseepsis]|uniref:Chemotaxis protein CheW n=1 Tax=Phototrophicus methaneseepsis TaxID=2710758 RepID=A0A7S8IGI2_9CHLR|nr:chemotaxis protein CheW [Phototrophicus methaneseepsis]QPC84674.1 chemotaxis protein CheW [Phototrophicus methaneseepsis]
MTDKNRSRQQSKINQAKVNWDDLLVALEWDSAERRQADTLTRLSLRAAQYAEPTRHDAQNQLNTQTCLTFTLAKERYAIDIAYVRGVQTTGRITRVPGAPDFYPGVVNMRGRIITVFDLRQFFGLEVDEEMPPEMIQMEVNQLHLGLLADHVEGVILVPNDTIEPLDILYAHGITREKLVVLDMEKLAGDERLIVNGVIRNGMEDAG